MPPLVSRRTGQERLDRDRRTRTQLPAKVARWERSEEVRSMGALRELQSDMRNQSAPSHRGRSAFPSRARKLHGTPLYERDAATKSGRLHFARSSGLRSLRTWTRPYPAVFLPLFVESRGSVTAPA